MKANRYVRILSSDSPSADAHDDLQTAPSTSRLAAPLRRAILQTRQWLLSAQQLDGCWVGELQGDTILESEYVLLLAYLGRHQSESAHAAARYILDQQLTDGGWSLYPGGKVDISASVKAYFALKLTGHDPSAESMQKARAAILAHGGADAVNSFTRFYLALLGQISYDHCPAVPPEVLLLPRWSPVSIYQVSAWSRTILVPLSIMSAHQPVTKIDSRLGISELFLKRPEHWPPLRCPGKTGGAGLLSWDRFFRTVDRAFKFLQRRSWLPLRKRAIRVAEKWMIERFAGSEGLGAIFPPMIWSIVALRCLGYSDESPEVKYCHEHLEGLVIRERDTIRLQPCKSPVWDTAITLRALHASGLDSSDDAVRDSIEWLLANEVRRRGDWRETVRAEPGGWCFEYANEFYPDIDDTIMVMMALESHRSPAANGETLPPRMKLIADPSRANRADTAESADAGRSAFDARITAACERGLAWVLSMQNRDGGWGAFDRDNDSEFLCHVPFADHNAMIDPSTPDLTGRVLEMLGQRGRQVGDPVVDRAVAYMRRTQEADGSWFGRWGVNYIYGAWQAILGLAAVGLPLDDPMLVAATNWLLAYQQPDGGWGESPDSYAEPHLRGQGPTTASQTAWAVLGLIAAGLANHPATQRGVRFLIGRQNEDGRWDEPEFTGTGFPQVFYLRYHMYPIYFPLLALATWAKVVGAPLEEAKQVSLRLAECSL